MRPVGIFDFTNQSDLDLLARSWSTIAAIISTSAMGNLGAGYPDGAYRPTQKRKYRTGNAIGSIVSLSSYPVDTSDVGRLSELQEGTLISVSDTVEMTNGHITKIGRMRRNSLGVIMPLGELFILHDERLPAVPMLSSGHTVRQTVSKNSTLNTTWSSYVR